MARCASSPLNTAATHVLQHSHDVTDLRELGAERGRLSRRDMMSVLPWGWEGVIIVVQDINVRDRVGTLDGSEHLSLEHECAVGRRRIRPQSYVPNF